jgi:predicted DsbA family dithiol-disulfide isomerase
MKLTIDVISDVICPWCYIGKRRLEKALALASPAEALVRWHPFQLNPQMPKAGVSRREYRTNKFGSWERSLALDAQVAEAGRGEGIGFAFDRMERTPNSFDAHRLIQLAAHVGVQDAVVEGLFQAYFTDGRDLADVGTLLDIAGEAGLERDRAQTLLAGDEGIDEIRAAEEQARRAGVQGVPLFVVNESVVLSGAREPKEFLAAFGQVAAPGEVLGDSCEIGLDGKPAC